MKCTKCLQVCGKKQLRVWQTTTCIPWRAKDALFIPLPPGLQRFSGRRRDQHEEDEPQNDAWQAVFDYGEEVQMSALHLSLGAMSVHKGHRIFHHRDVLVCVKCGGRSTWVNRKLRRDCPGNPSKLSIEVLKRMANPRPGPLCALPIPHGAVGGEGLGREWVLSLCRSDVAPECGVSVLRAPFGLRFAARSGQCLQRLARVCWIFGV